MTRYARLSLTLLVPRVLADHHDAAVATNHLALVTDLLDAGLDLHCCTSLPSESGGDRKSGLTYSGTRSAHGTDRRESIRLPRDLPGES